MFVLIALAGLATFVAVIGGVLLTSVGRAAALGDDRSLAAARVGPRRARPRRR